MSLGRQQFGKLLIPLGHLVSAAFAQPSREEHGCRQGETGRESVLAFPGPTEAENSSEIEGMVKRRKSSKTVLISQTSYIIR